MFMKQKRQMISAFVSVIAQLICTFVFHTGKVWFSHDAARIQYQFVDHLRFLFEIIIFIEGV